MAAQGEPSEKYGDAERPVKKRSFMMHLTFYVLINAMLIIFNLVSSPGTIWFHWPLLGWGIGLAMHFISFTFPDGKIKE